MNWYLAKLVFRIVCGDGAHAAQFDEQLRLVEGNNLSEATSKAVAMGKREEDSFFNHQNQLVQWRFIDISEVYEIGGLIDGAELYSRIVERENAETYIHTIHQKAMAIRQATDTSLLPA